MKRLIIAVLLFASLAMAETVYLTPHGKTYHTDRQCPSLTRSTHVLTADDAEVKAHGLTECSRCAHRKAGKTAATAGNSTWATPETKEAGK